jgi:hypothetical protein
VAQLFSLGVIARAMLKTTGILASIVAVVCLLASMPFYHRGPQDSSIVGHGVIAAADLLSLILFVSINLALSFSLSFTPLLGVGLLVRMKTPTQDYRKAIQTFAVSLIPFAISLWCFWGFILPAILHQNHQR